MTPVNLVVRRVSTSIQCARLSSSAHQAPSKKSSSLVPAWGGHSEGMWVGASVSAGGGCGVRDPHLHIEATALGAQPMAQHGGGQDLVVLDAVGLQADGGASWGQWRGGGEGEGHPSTQWGARSTPLGRGTLTCLLLRRGPFILIWLPLLPPCFFGFSWKRGTVGGWGKAQGVGCEGMGGGGGLAPTFAVLALLLCPRVLLLLLAAAAFLGLPWGGRAAVGDVPPAPGDMPTTRGTCQPPALGTCQPPNPGTCHPSQNPAPAHLSQGLSFSSSVSISSPLSGFFLGFGGGGSPYATAGWKGGGGAGTPL